MQHSILRTFRKPAITGLAALLLGAVQPLQAEDEEESLRSAWSRAIPAEQRSELARFLKIMSQRLWIAIREPDAARRAEQFQVTASAIWTLSERIHSSCTGKVPLVEPYFFSTGSEFMKLWDRFNAKPTLYQLQLADMDAKPVTLARDWLLTELELPQEYHLLYGEERNRYLRNHGFDPESNQRDVERYNWCLRQYRSPFAFVGRNLPILDFNLQIFYATRLQYNNVKSLKQNAQTLLFHQWFMYRGLKMFEQPALVLPTLSALEDKLEQIQCLLSIALSSDTQAPQKRYFAKLVSEMEKLAQFRAEAAERKQLFDEAEVLRTVSMKFGQMWLKNDQNEEDYQVWLCGLTPEQLVDPELLEFQLEYYLRNAPQDKESSRSGDRRDRGRSRNERRKSASANARAKSLEEPESSPERGDELPIPSLPGCLKEVPGKELLPYLLSYNHRVYLTQENRKKSYKKLRAYKSELTIYCSYLSRLRKASAACRARELAPIKQIGEGQTMVKPGTTDYRAKASNLSDLYSGSRKKR